MLNLYVRLVILCFRTWLVISSQININTAFEQDLMEVKTTYPKDILVLGPCLQYNPINNTIRCTGEDIYKYPDILHVKNMIVIIFRKNFFLLVRNITEFFFTFSTVGNILFDNPRC